VPRRRRGRSAVGCDGDDLADHAVQIGQYFLSGVAHDKHALRGKPCVAMRIPRRAIAPIMGFAIDLDRQTRRCAIEVEHIVARRMLSAEAQPVFVPSQREPQGDFRGRHVLT
jgi:hypothetical protein